MNFIKILLYLKCFCQKEDVRYC